MWRKKKNFLRHSKEKCFSQGKWFFTSENISPWFFAILMDLGVTLCVQQQHEDMKFRVNLRVSTLLTNLLKMLLGKYLPLLSFTSSLSKGVELKWIHQVEKNLSVLRTLIQSLPRNKYLFPVYNIKEMKKLGINERKEGICLELLMALTGVCLGLHKEVFNFFLFIYLWKCLCFLTSGCISSSCSQTEAATASLWTHLVPCSDLIL